MFRWMPVQGQVFQSSGAIVTRNPSSAADIRIWQDSREFAWR
jgi:hypothetical protein